MVESGERHDLHPRNTPKPLPPGLHVLVAHLVVAFSTEDQDRLAQVPGRSDLIAIGEIIPVRGRDSHDSLASERSILQTGHLCFHLGDFFLGSSEVSHLGQHDVRQRASRRGKQDDARDRVGLLRDFGRKLRAQTVPEHEQALGIHFGPSP